MLPIGFQWSKAASCLKQDLLKSAIEGQNYQVYSLDALFFLVFVFTRFFNVISFLDPRTSHKIN